MRVRLGGSMLATVHRSTGAREFGLTPRDRASIAEDLYVATVHSAPIARLSDRYRAMTVVDSYEIQRIVTARHIEAGAVVRGHKVGLSSRAMQQMMGVDEPDYGHLLSDMFVAEYSTIDISALCAPRVEVEVAFVLAEDLPAPGCTVADVLRCTAFVCPALEIIDSRIIDWDIGLLDTIADNASSGLLVLGGRRTPVSAVDLRTIGATLRSNGRLVDTGAAGAVLGNPATAVAWLANKLHPLGVGLEAGHVVLPGSCTRAHDVAAGQTIRADFDVLGHVCVRFEDGPR
jgi:2-keto-4-pentenoate hydratase